MLTYKEFRKKLLTELEQRGIKFEITSMTSVNGEKERISIAFSNFTTDNAVDSDHKPETFGLYPDHEYANYLGLCESESESPVERIVDDALQIMSQLSEKVSLEYVNSLLKLRDEDIIYQLINAKKNEELLKKVPHRIVADDLAVIYRIYKTEIDENSDEKLVTSTIILNSLMEESRYTEETMDAPYRKKRRYYGMLDREIHKSVTGYMDGLKRDTFTVIERLDIKEFKKSRKVNGMFSCFARGKTQEALMKALNWKGYDFVEVAPEFTSQVCPVCGNLDSANRDGKRFKCICCGHEDDADHVGSINIRERAVNKDLMDICEKHRYGNGLQNALKDYYMEQNEIFKKQHPQGMVS